jgi:hypothetical protein
MVTDPVDASSAGQSARSQTGAAYPKVKLIIDIVQAVGVISGIIFGFWTIINFQNQMKLFREQLEIQNRITKATVISNASQRLETLNMIMFDHPELAQYVSDEFDPKRMLWKSEHDQSRVLTYYFGTMNVFDEVADYHKLELISEEDWGAWTRSFGRIVIQPAFSTFWPEMRVEYSESFQGLVDSLRQGR